MTLNIKHVTSILTFTTISLSHAQVSVLNPTSDGDARTFGGDEVRTINNFITFSQSGGNTRSAILEFDLSSIADTDTILSATLSFTLTSVISNLGSNPAEVDIFAYNGDGIVDISDFSTSGTAVYDSTTASGGSSGDVRSFVFSSTTPISDALNSNLLTLRIETDNFATVNFASLENTTLDAATLTIDSIPEPSSAALLGLGAIFSGLIRRRA